MNKVLVISMEKAGSTTVMHTIRSAGFEVGRVHRHNMHEVNPDDYSHFVVPVREPIAKSISNYFETGKTIDIIREVSFTLGFFDDYVHRICKINVMGKPDFNTQNGWMIYDNKLLVIRVEDFDQQLRSALKWLLGLFVPHTVFEVIHHSVGSDRFGDGYTKFIKQARFDRDYVERIAESLYCQKFGYSKEVMKWIH